MKKIGTFLVFCLLALPVLAKEKGRQIATSEAKDFDCGGTEPFFNVKIRGKRLEYNDPLVSSKVKKYNTSGPRDAAGLSSGNVFTYTDKNKTILLTLLNSTMAGGTCSDGMSEQVYSHHLILVQDDHTYYGCCNAVK